MKSITLGWILLFILTIPVALNEFINGVHLPQDYIEDKVFLSDGSGYTVARQYASVTFGNLNNYVLVCCFCLPFALLATHLFIKRIVLTWGIVLVLLSFIAINASRGGFLCAALAVFVYLCVSVKKKKIKVKTIIVAFTLLSIPILYYFQQIFLQLTIRLTEHSLFEDYARLLIYGNVLEVVADTNGFGAGIGGLTSALLSISTTDHWRLLKSVNAKLLNSVFMLVTRFSGLQTLSHFSNDYIGVGALKLGSPIFHECRTIHFQPDC